MRLPTNRLGSGAFVSGRNMPSGFDLGQGSRGIGGTSTKCLSGSTGSSTAYGERWIRMVMRSIFWFNRVETRKRPSVFFRNMLKRHGYSPQLVVTDQLKSYGAAHRELGMGAVHDTGCYRNNRAENSHQPTRQKERQMRGFKSACHAQRLLSAQGSISDLFRHDRHLMRAQSYREPLPKGKAEWDAVAGLAPVV